MTDDDDVLSILDTMPPRERFVFGLQYLFKTVRGKLISDDGAAADAFVQQTCDCQRTQQVGDFQP
jgi:hypothetical protein